jgi:LmbE family N-acetylglucosaminyl deacetylase
VTVHIYLSPHLDDAAISCGGDIHQLSRAGEPVWIITVFTAAPAGPLSSYATGLHEAQSFSSGEDAILGRLAEDREATALLGARARHLDFLDAIYRPVGDLDSGGFAYETAESVFGAIHAADARLPVELAARISTAIGEIAGDAPTRVYAPLAVGSHVDHRIVRRAAERLDLAVRYYEDVPYVLDKGALAAAKDERFVAELRALSDADFSAKLDAIMAYRSQNRFSREQVHAYLERYGRHVGGGSLAERLWKIPT